MQIVFRRTAARRYAIQARRPGYPDIGMDPAPGYDPLMPHDVLHMVVEAELGLTRAVFGQLAAGGDAGSFHRDLEPAGDARERRRRQRRTVSRGEKLLREGREESAQSERAAYLCWYEWLARADTPERRRLGASMKAQAEVVRGTCPPAEAAALTEEVIRRICRRLDEIGVLWAELEVGQGVAVSWPELRVTRIA